ncbi:DEAD/DEAH box helicase [Eremomyces bilateralis CBS 781.70]|uniref:RNA helicase n=1 Tax=Eremomyces bilateralis CBS 781.70 TaxID=1392243 RepID=A0A6G1G108_9PEZI|nr:DEAD/DEAH box helicase [Eremomyces bilateralis CBS 781.70]KAF1811672.1 DEAD/DEAH box helicase [Eremomyces bilateralis CBS 781.70]
MAIDDDFILTISDNDEDILVADEEETAEPPTAPTTSRKRKHEEVAGKANGTKNVKKAKNKGSKKTNGAKGKPQPESSDEEEDENQYWADGGEDDGAIDSDFEFQVGDGGVTIDDEFDGWGLSASKATTDASVKKGVDLDQIIERRRQANGETNGDPENKGDAIGDEDASPVSDGSDEDKEEFGGFSEEEDVDPAEFGAALSGAANGHDDSEDDEEEDEALDGNSEEESEAEPMAHPDDISDASDSEPDAEEQAKRTAFFAPEPKAAKGAKGDKGKKESNGFQAMSLSRPVLRGVDAVGFTTPTPIQAKTIPVALLGKDIVGGAVTGSGKTGAFIIPIIERLLYRPKKIPTTRVAILMPTRELAVQCFTVAKKLASFTDITFAQIIGGFSLREQEAVLRSRPDVVIATPGRFIDHMRNSASFNVEMLEILVLDEADRMLEDGFADELNEILTEIPKSRQTMLFSATMTQSVDKLIRVGMNRPVRLLVDAKKQTVSGLVQEFVRLRPGKEDKRLAYLLYICSNLYTNRVIIFFRAKKLAHRVRIIFGLCGLKAAELHGSMSQEQRIQAVESFRAGTVSFLLATDLASRGLDIKGVETVVNYEAPQSHEIYLHRVGRTARAGRTGRSCTLAAEPDRKVVKAAVKSAREQGAKITSRTIPQDEGDAWAKKLEKLEEEVEEVLQEEKEERAMAQGERDMKKGENLMEFQEEIMSRPKRTWFETEADKKKAKEAGLKELNGPGEEKGKRVKKKLSNKEIKKAEAKDQRKGEKMWKKGKDAGQERVVKTGKSARRKTGGKRK